MAVVADQVVVEILARVDRAETDINRYNRVFEAGMRKAEADSRQMEAAIREDAERVSATLKGLAGSFAQYFSPQRVAELADGYTRFTNQLKIAGLEGQSLGNTQERLFAIAQKYGVQLEAVGTLYGQNAASATELNLTQEQQFRIVEAMSASLRVSGQSATEAASAMQQLSKVLRGTKVDAGEYNSLVGDALPLLQAVAAGSEQWGGSVTKLTGDVEAGKVSVQEFTQALLMGADGVIAAAEGSIPTLSGAFVSLNDALGKYIGETDQSLSATERIAQGITSLADNLDTVIGVLGVFGAVLVGRTAASLVRVGGATTAVSGAIFAMQARAVGAATSMEALAFAGATAGRSLLAAFGGPVGIAVAALSLGLTMFATDSADAGEASDDLGAAIAAQTAEFAELAKKQEQAKAETNTLSAEQRAALESTAKLTGEADLLATAWGRVAAQAKAAAVEQARAAVLHNKKLTQDARREYLDKRETEFRKAPRPFAERGLSNNAMPENVEKALADSEAAAKVERDRYIQSLKNLKLSNAALQEEINRPLATYKPPQAPATPTTRTTRTTNRASAQKPSGPSAEELKERFLDAVARGTLEYGQALADLVGTVEARETFERSRIDIEREMAKRAIMADKSLTDERRDALLQMTENTANVRRAVQQQSEQQRLDDNRSALVQAGIANERELLEARGQLATTAEERRAIELRLLDLQYKEERLQLERIRDDERADETERQKARDRLEIMPQIYTQNRMAIERKKDGALGEYFRSIPDTAEQIDNVLQNIAVGSLKNVEDGFAQAATKALGLKGAIGSVVQELIKLAFQQTVLKALFGLVNGIGGGFGSLGTVMSNNANFTMAPTILKPEVPLLPGRANGGPVAAGGTYLVGERGPEILRMGAQGGVVIPNHQIAAPAGGGTTVVQNFTLDARGGITTPQLLAQVNNTITQAGTAAALAGGMEGERRVMKRASRRIPW